MTERLMSAELRGEVRRRDDERRLRKVLGVSGDEQGIVALRGKSYAVEDSVVRVGEPKIVGLCNCVNVRLCRARRSFSLSRGLSITNGMRRSLRVLRYGGEMTAVRRDSLRLERRYRQHVHAVGSLVRRAGKPYDDCQRLRGLSAGFGNSPLDVKQMLRGGFLLVDAELDFDRRPFAVRHFDYGVDSVKFVKIIPSDSEYLFRDIRKNYSARFGTFNVADSQFPMYQIRTFQCSKLAISNVADSEVSDAA